MPFAAPGLVLNPAREPGAYPPSLETILAPGDVGAAQRQIGAWPGYAPTPLVNLAGLAKRHGLAAVHYKDERHRFALKSFKALGGALAVERLLARLAAQGTAPADVTVACATDGNHGRSVAWGAERFGCACRIYLHATVSDARKRAIEAFGAEIVRTPGNYDDSVRRAAADAAAHGWHVVSDTSYPGYVEIPKDVMRGYMVMAAEAFDELVEVPTHIAVQGGVGGLAAAVLAVAWQRWGPHRPRFLVVEPDRAACVARSLEAGAPATAPGDLDTVMAGLACGEISLLAWDILHAGADAALVIDDDAAVAVMRMLAAPAAGDRPLVAGESATCGLAGVLAARERPACAEALGLDARSRVLVFGTEGDTDEDLYTQLVGRTAAEVLAR